MRFGKKGKLTPRFIGPFEILERVGPVAYRFTLPPSLADVHNVFHVSMLRKYYPDPSHILQWEPLELGTDLSFEEIPIRILDRRIKKLRSKTIPLMKVLWQYHGVEEATWETEDEMQPKYPQLFLS
ncbi:Chromo domain-containing protein [Cephalotus follicularis]|uniref:Chromo domain-containing protein n=1 Tax=Cephalotus follicularis TaxID=3775 RepID=A0A1Q3C5R5_CEPFO|nr:Chromo domain-containing protein [Cephalotus follicularis]